MELAEAILKRRSVRQFQRKEVPDSVIDILLEAAVRAPSEGNLQPWRFYVIKNEKTKKALADAALGQIFVAEAPVVIVVCIDAQATAPYGKRGLELYSIQSTAAAIENILLTVVSLGLGACWVGAFKENEVHAALDLEQTLRPVALIPVGCPAESPPLRRRKSLEEVTFYVE